MVEGGSAEVVMGRSFPTEVVSELTHSDPGMIVTDRLGEDDGEVELWQIDVKEQLV
jgi:hypothetical protein